MIERFQCAGTGSEELMAICEAYYKEGMEKEELESKLYQIITAACDRDMYSGWGTVVYIVSKDGITTNFYNTKQS
jgi:20S proteasome subunit beta 3